MKIQFLLFPAKNAKPIETHRPLKEEGEPMCNMRWLGILNALITNPEESLFSISVFRILFILMWIRIRGSTSGNCGSDLRTNKFQFCYLNFYCKKYNTRLILFCNLWVYYLCVFNNKAISFLKIILIIVVDFYASL